MRKIKIDDDDDDEVAHLSFLLENEEQFVIYQGLARFKEKCPQK
jgi:hypothetical protein